MEAFFAGNIWTKCSHKGQSRSEGSNALQCFFSVHYAKTPVCIIRMFIYPLCFLYHLWNMFWASYKTDVYLEFLCRMWGWGFELFQKMGKIMWKLVLVLNLWSIWRERHNWVFSNNEGLSDTFSGTVKLRMQGALFIWIQLVNQYSCSMGSLSRHIDINFDGSYFSNNEWQNWMFCLWAFGSFSWFSSPLTGEVINDAKVLALQTGYFGLFSE